MGHAHTPYYVVQNLVTNLLELDTCRTAPEREHALMQHITDLKLRERMFLLNDLLGTHVSEFFFVFAPSYLLHVRSTFERSSKEFLSFMNGSMYQ